MKLIYNIKIFGIVQGVGFRPFIKNLADSFFICGTVANKGSYVEIFAQNDENIFHKEFLYSLR
ncbi:MAG: acylphosphatase [Selenomonadaceae bacterium]|nr:acylphosphatase [Selenomonadaceae bacterium]